MDSNKFKNNVKINNSVKRINSNDLNKINYNLFNKNSSFSFRKDNDFIKWRYINRPHKEYVMVGNFSFEDEINGYMILGKYKTKTGKIRCQIVDFRVEKLSILNQLINMAEIIAQEIGAELIDLIISEKSNELKEFKNLDYNKTNEFYKLMVFPNTINNFTSNALLGDFDAV